MEPQATHGLPSSAAAFRRRREQGSEAPYLQFFTQEVKKAYNRLAYG
jgi:hypothetical protein